MRLEPDRPPPVKPRARGPVVLALSVTIAVAALVGGGPARAQTPAVPREAVEQIIREYLLNHPEVIVESIRRAQQREREAARAQSRTQVQAHRQALLSDQDSPVGGNPTGDVTVVEFFDYRCPHCRRMAPVMKALLTEDPQIRLVYKELPILGEESLIAARAALAAQRQGRYVEAHDRLMAEAGPLTRPAVLSALAAIGLDADRLRRDMDSPEVAALIGRELALAQALGIDGTPALVIGSELVVGAIDLGAIRELISRARRAP